MFGRTTGLSSWPRRCRAGSTAWARRPPSSSPAAPGENGHVESFNGKLRDELLNGEVFNTAGRSQGADRAVAGALQHRPPSFLAWLQTTRSGGDHARRRQAHAPSQLQRFIGPATAQDPLKPCPDQSMGAGQSHGVPQDGRQISVMHRSSNCLVVRRPWPSQQRRRAMAISWGQAWCHRAFTGRQGAQRRPDSAFDLAGTAAAGRCRRHRTRDINCLMSR